MQWTTVHWEMLLNTQCFISQNSAPLLSDGDEIYTDKSRAFSGDALGPELRSSIAVHFYISTCVSNHVVVQSTRGAAVFGSSGSEPDKRTSSSGFSMLINGLCKC